MPLGKSFKSEPRAWNHHQGEGKRGRDERRKEGRSLAHRWNLIGGLIRVKEASRETRLEMAHRSQGLVSHCSHFHLKTCGCFLGFFQKPLNSSKTSVVEGWFSSCL
ncbi:unnamed protein product [Arctogadus glacialis]